jgi:ribose transport system substrate-binding protein
LSDVEDLLAQGVDGLLINPLDPSAFNTLIAEAAEQGIPTVAVDSGVDPSTLVVSESKSNNFQNGEAVGRWLVEDKMQGKPIKIAWLSAEQGNVAAKERRLGLISGIVEASLRLYGKVDVEIVGHVYAGGWGFDEALTAAEDLITAHRGKFNVLGGESDAGSVSGQKALAAAGIGPDEVTIVTSADAYIPALELIKAGQVGGTGLNSPYMTTILGVQVLEAYFNGRRDIPRYTYTPPLGITQSNIDQYWDTIMSDKEMGRWWPVFEMEGF